MRDAGAGRSAGDGGGVAEEFSHTSTRRLEGGMAQVWMRGHNNVRKHVLIQAAACNIELLLRHQTGVGAPRSL